MIALFGGSKSQHALHHSNHEIIQRIDCWEHVPHTDSTVLHLEAAIAYTHFVMAVPLPDERAINDQDKNCFAIVHENIRGQRKNLPLNELTNNSEYCDSRDALHCYRFLLKESANVSVASSHNIKWLTNTNTSCMEFGHLDNDIETMQHVIPIDQGIMMCRINKTDNAWYPAGVFQYNNTQCHSFYDGFPIRSLTGAYEYIQDIIGKCN